tara:strand:+ start:3641 stop:5578 length:1938 start_codon:yes stop_codon:yes gene_type:complete
MTLSQSVADELAAKFADAHWVKFKEARLFCEAPVYTRGVPHGLIPGIHACCDHMIDGLEALREINCRTESTTVDVIASLPFSPWTQAIAPTIEATADLSMRLCVRDPSLLATGTGKAYLPDSTDIGRALLAPPLLDGPVQVSIADNPFGTSYEHIDSFFNCANAIAAFTRLLDVDDGRHPIDVLHDVVSKWILSSDDESAAVLREPHRCLLAADVLVLLSCMYPATWKVAERCIHDTWAAALPALTKRVQALLDEFLLQEETEQVHFWTRPRYLILDRLDLEPALVEAGRAWWRAFCRTKDGTCAWKDGVAPLLKALYDHDGSYAVSKSMVGAMRSHLERAVRAGFLVASEDGEAPPRAPCPASTAKSAERVKRPHVDPVFVGDVARGVDATGCLVGLKPHQLRQVAALSMGAHLDDVEVQVHRNEGAFLLKFQHFARCRLAYLPTCPLVGVRRWIEPPSELSARHLGIKWAAAHGQVHLAGVNPSLAHNIWILHRTCAFFSLSSVSCVCMCVCVCFANRCKPRVRFIALIPSSRTHGMTPVCDLAADESAFGSRKDKLVGCARQRAAWDGNTKLLAPVFTAVRPPLPKTQRLRGELGTAFKKQRESSVLKRDQRLEANTEMDARHAIEDAVVSTLSQSMQLTRD